MQELSDPRMLIIALQGLPLTIAILLTIEHQPVTEKHLCSMLTRSDKTVASALHKLKELQIIHRTTQGWTITANSQLPLMAIQDPFNSLVKNSRNISDFSPSSSCSLNKNQTEIAMEEQEQESEYFRLLKRTCILAGIREPKATTISHIPGITSAMINAHIDQAIAEGQTVGTAIYRLEHGWPIATRSGNEDARKKYIEGKYSEYFASNSDD